MSSQQSSTNSVATKCENCIFANIVGNKQVSCKINVLHKLAKWHGSKRRLSTYVNNDTRYYTIDGRLCWYYRNNLWPHYNKTTEEIIEQLHNEVYLKYDIIILCDDGDLTKLKETVDSIPLYDIKPQHIYITCKYKSIELSKLFAWCHNNIKGLNWSCELLVEDDNSIKTIARRSKSIFLLVLEAGEDVDEEFPSKLNDEICRKLKQIMMVRPIDGLHELFIMRQLVTKISPLNSKLVQSVNRIVEWQKCQYLIRSRQHV